MDEAWGAGDGLIMRVECGLSVREDRKTRPFSSGLLLVLSLRLLVTEYRNYNLFAWSEKN